MRVDLLLVVDHLARPCGVRTTYLKMIEGCAKAGISVALISDTDELFPYSSIKARLDISVDDNLKIMGIKRRPLLSLIDHDGRIVHEGLIDHGIEMNDAYYLDAWNGNKDWLNDTERKCRNFIDNIEATQILIATQSFLGFAVRSLLKQANVSICLHTHYAAFYAIRITGSENELFHLISSKITERLNEIFIKPSRRIFLVSETSRRFFELNDGQEIQTFLPGVDTLLFKPVPKIPCKNLRILYVGRWSKDKGTEMFTDLICSLPLIDWTIAGNEPGDEMQCPQNVRQLGMLDHINLAKEMSISDLVIFYGKWDTFGLVALEALSSGVPVLAYSSSEIARLIEQHNCGLTFDSKAQLIKLIEMLQSDRRQLDDLGTNARKAAVQTTWTKSIDIFLGKLGLFTVDAL